MAANAGGTGFGFGANYLRKEMLMGAKDHNRNFWLLVQNKWDHTQQLEEQGEEE